MNAIVDVHQAKTHPSRLLDRAHAGEEVIIGKAGRPYARLVPMTPRTKRRLGFIDGTLDELLSSRCRRANWTRRRSQRNSGSDGYPVQ